MFSDFRVGYHFRKIFMSSAENMKFLVNLLIPVICLQASKTVCILKAVHPKNNLRNGTVKGGLPLVSFLFPPTNAQDFEKVEGPAGKEMPFLPRA